MYLPLQGVAIDMKKTCVLAFWALSALAALAAESANDPLLGFRDLWNTNVVSYGRVIRPCVNAIARNEPERIARWFVTVIGDYEDIFNTNQVVSSLREKHRIIRDYACESAVVSNTNAWHATARFFARVRSGIPGNANRQTELMRILREKGQGEELLDWNRRDRERRRIRQELELTEKEVGEVLADVFVRRGMSDMSDSDRATAISNVCHAATMNEEEMTALIRGNRLPIRKKWTPENDPDWKNVDGVWIGPVKDCVE